MVKAALRYQALFASKALICVLSITVLYFMYNYNVWEYAMAVPFAYFQYPLDIDLKHVIDKVSRTEDPGVEPINSLRFPYIMNCEKKCRTDDGDIDNVYILFLIKSRLENTHQRQMIRRTWGNEFSIPKVIIRRVFLLGVEPKNKNVQHQIGLESRDYEDIVQQFFIDSYYNNTIKLLMGFQWATEYCAGAQFLVFLDDDYYVSPHNLVRLISQIPSTAFKNTIVGYIWQNAVPFRIKHNKWYVSLEEYPYSFWPPYPTAGSFIVPMETAKQIHIAAPYVKYIRFDDVYIGIVAWKLKINLKHSDKLLVYLDAYTKELFRDVVASHGFSDIEFLYKVWKEQEEYRKLRVSKLLISKLNFHLMWCNFKFMCCFYCIAMLNFKKNKLNF